MTIKELIKQLKHYPSDAHIDFVIVDRDWEDSCKDAYLNCKGIVGSGADMDIDEERYVELAFEVCPEHREFLAEQLSERKA